MVDRYKPCCGMRCCVGGCKTRESGGCYCLCRLKDMEASLLSLLSGESYRFMGGIVYEPGRVPIPLGGFEKDNALKDLDRVREGIKGYEVKE